MIYDISVKKWVYQEFHLEKSSKKVNSILISQKSISIVSLNNNYHEC